MSFVLWYPTPEYLFCLCDRILVDAYGGFLPCFFFLCGAGALGERAVLSLDTLFPERRTGLLFLPSACESRYLCHVGNTTSRWSTMGYDECKCKISYLHDRASFF